MNVDFKADISNSDVDIWKINKHFNVSPNIDMVTTTEQCAVKYAIDFDLRSYGLNGVSINIKHITARIQVEVYTEDCSEDEKELLIKAGGKEYRNTITKEIELDIDHLSTDWKIKNEIEFTNDGVCVVSNVEFDMYLKIVTIS